MTPRRPPPVAVACPRCGGPPPTQWYGPCKPCRQELREWQGQVLAWRAFLWWLTEYTRKVEA